MSGAPHASTLVRLLFSCKGPIAREPEGARTLHVADVLAGVEVLCSCSGWNSRR